MMLRVNKPNIAAPDVPVPAPVHEPMRCISVNKAYAKIVGRLPSELNTFPSMMSVPEKRLLYGLANTYYSANGLIIDAGIFLGASTRCFGEGVKANLKALKSFSRFATKKPIVSFERGIVNPGMPDFFTRNKVNFSAEPGETFEPWLRDVVKPIADVVDLRIGDILETMGSIKDPVEILFLDVLKLPNISKAVIAKFFPLLIPGRSIVVQQDYFYERLEFIKTDQEFFSDYFTYIGEVGSSGLFLCTKKIDAAAIAAFRDDIPARKQIELAAQAMQRSNDPARRFLMAISKVRLLKKLQGSDAAEEYLDVVTTDYPEQVQSSLPRLKEAMTTIRKHLKKKGGPDSD